MNIAEYNGIWRSTDGFKINKKKLIQGVQKQRFEWQQHEIHTVQNFLEAK